MIHLALFHLQELSLLSHTKKCRCEKSIDCKTLLFCKTSLRQFVQHFVALDIIHVGVSLDRATLFLNNALLSHTKGNTYRCEEVVDYKTSLTFCYRAFLHLKGVLTKRERYLWQCMGYAIWRAANCKYNTCCKEKLLALLEMRLSESQSIFTLIQHVHHWWCFDGELTN